MKKNYYRVLSILVIATMFLGVFTACGSSNSQSSVDTKTEASQSASNETEKAKDSPKVTLTLRHIDNAETNKANAMNIQDAADRFMKDNPNVEVKIEALDHDTHRAKLKAEVAGGTPPDLFMTWGYSFSEPFYNAGKLLDISSIIKDDKEWSDGFVPGTLEAFHYGDGYYGIPRDGFAEGIFYNKKIFEKFGITPPKTFDELKQTIVKLKDNGIIPIGIGNKEKWPSTFIHNFFFDRQAGYDLYEKLMKRESGFSWVNDDYIKANDKIIELVKLGAFPEGAAAITRDEGTALFYQGKAAMYADGTWSATSFESDAAPKGFANDIGFINFPTFSDGKGDQNSIIAGFTAGFSICAEVKGTDKEKPALELLKYLNDDTFAERTLYDSKTIPARTIAKIDTTKTSALMGEILAVLNSSSLKVLPYNDTMPTGMAEVYYDISQAIFANVMTPKDAMQKLEDAANEYIKK